MNAIQASALVTDHPPDVDGAAVDPAADAARGLTSEIRDLWQRGESADARAVLERHPEVRADKSVVLDVAYEEYCLRLEAGQPPDPDEFCDRFPSYRASLRRLIEAHRFLEEHSYLLADGKPAKWPETGQSFLGFQLGRELGRGAFARVFLATEPALGGRRVAVKLSLQGTAEAETLGRISHPNIVPVHSVQQDAETGLTVVCMPYLGSATLCDVLDRVFVGNRAPARAQAILDAVRGASLSEEDIAERRAVDPFLGRCTYVEGVIHLGVQLADALACIHALGICHRDLKPSNVLLSPDGRPMLLDFNLSFDERVADNRLGGTLPYMSPEQLLATDLERGAGPSLIDARSDIFSLGLLLYELFTGAHPFGPVPLKLNSPELRRHLLARHRGRPRPVRELNPRVERSLARLLERCLAYNPNDRPPTPVELATALRRQLSPLHRLRRWVAQHPAKAAAAALAGVALSGTAAYGVALQDSSAERELQHGHSLYVRGDYAGAVRELSASINDRKTPEAFYLRGRALVKSFEFRDAIQDFLSAERLAPGGRTEACLGYCFAAIHEPGQAGIWNERAVASGFMNAATLNNLGYSLGRAWQLNRARAILSRAIELDYSMQQAYYNRAVLDIEASQYSNGYHVPFAVSVVSDALLPGNSGALAAVVRLDRRLAFDYSPRAGIDDIRKALEIGPPSAALYGKAAILCAQAAAQDPAWKAPAFEYLRQGMELGLRVAQVEPYFKPFEKDARYREIASTTQQRYQAPEFVHIVDPVGDTPE